MLKDKNNAILILFMQPCFSGGSSPNNAKSRPVFNPPQSRVMLPSYCFRTVLSLFYQLLLVVMGLLHEADNAYSIRSTWLCYRLV